MRFFNSFFNKKIIAQLILGLIISTQFCAPVFADFSLARSWVAKDARATKVLAQSAVASSVTGTTDETTLATYTLPAGAMGLNGTLRIHLNFTGTSNSNSKSIKIRCNGTNINTLSFTTTPQTPTYYWSNRNSASSQLLSINTTTKGATTIDTSVAVTIDFIGQLGTGTDTETLEGYTIELLPGAS